MEEVNRTVTKKRGKSAVITSVKLEGMKDDSGLSCNDCLVLLLS